MTPGKGVVRRPRLPGTGLVRRIVAGGRRPGDPSQRQPLPGGVRAIGRVPAAAAANACFSAPRAASKKGGLTRRILTLHSPPGPQEGVGSSAATTSCDSTQKDLLSRDRDVIRPPMTPRAGFGGLSRPMTACVRSIHRYTCPVDPRSANGGASHGPFRHFRDARRPEASWTG